MRNHLCSRIVLRTHNLPSEVLKNDFGKVDETMFKCVEIPFEVIFYIFGIVKSDLDEGA
jgi:hypothetical protein